jgi:predicted ABC-type transport system involved in lysophospholipase L1 biosynthesis ATPase subunit
MHVEPSLVLDGVGVFVRRGKRRWRVLKDVSLTVAPSEVVGIHAAPGTGKTTLLEVAAGLLEPAEGQVFIEGQSLASLSRDQRVDLRKDRVAWMHRGGVDEFEVAKYVALPVSAGRGMREATDLAVEALERVGIAHCAKQQWGQLSDWERVLVAFAKGYVRRPSLMVVDDLLDRLGPTGTRQAGELLLKLAEECGSAVLAASSEYESLLIAHRVLSLDAATITPKDKTVLRLNETRLRAGRGHG